MRVENRSIGTFLAPTHPHSHRTNARGESNHCVHCRGPILHTRLQNDAGESFCCAGCLKVHGWLHNKGWDFYYHLAALQKSAPPAARVSTLNRKELEALKDRSPEEIPGVRVASGMPLRGSSGKLAPREGQTGSRASLVRNARMQETGGNPVSYQAELASEAITCSACGWLLEKALSQIQGIQRVEVDFIQGRVSLTFKKDGHVLYNVMKQAMELGYPLYIISDDAPQQSPGPHSGLIARIAVSGAAFANVMTFTLAGYFGLYSESSSLHRLFLIYMFLITLPVVTWCATPFYKKAWAGLRKKYLHMDLPVSLGIVVAFATSVWAALAQSGHVYFDSVTGLVFFLLTGHWVVQHFERNIAMAAERNGPKVADAFQVLDRKSIEDETPDEKDRKFGKDASGTSGNGPGGITTNDYRNSAATNDYRSNEYHTNRYRTILKTKKDLRKGDTLLLAESDYIPVSGILESPTAWLDGSLLTGESDAVLYHQGDFIHSGYRNLRGSIALVIRENNPTGGLEKLEHKLKNLSPKNPEHIEGIARWFILGVFCLVALSFYLHRDKALAAQLAITASLLIITCPCALALASPLSYGMGLFRAQQLGFYLQSSNVLQKLRTVKALLFDKTGTLTFSQLQIKRWEWVETNKIMQHEILTALKRLTKQSPHPVSQTLYKSLADLSEMENLSSFEEHIGSGIEGTFSGLGRLEVSKATDFMIRPTGKWGKGRDTIQEKLPAQSEVENPSGALEELREVEQLTGETLIILNGKTVAAIWFRESIRPSVPAMVASLSKRFHLVLMSGDKPEKVEKFCRQTGFTECYASQSPDEKWRRCSQLSKQYGPVAAFGDGYNDQLLLAEARVGIAVETGVPSLKKRADVLFKSAFGGDFTRVPGLFRLAHRVHLSVVVCYTLSLAYNFSAVGFALAGKVGPLAASVLMPLSSLSVCLAVWVLVRAPGMKLGLAE